MSSCPDCNSQNSLKFKEFNEPRAVQDVVGCTLQRDTVKFQHRSKLRLKANPRIKRHRKHRKQVAQGKCLCDFEKPSSNLSIDDIDAEKKSAIGESSAGMKFSSAEHQLFLHIMKCQSQKVSRGKKSIDWGAFEKLWTDFVARIRAQYKVIGSQRRIDFKFRKSTQLREHKKSMKHNETSSRF